MTYFTGAELRTLDCHRFKELSLRVAKLVTPVVAPVSAIWLTLASQPLVKTIKELEYI